MEAPKLSRITMHAGVAMAVAAALLLLMSPFIINNFGTVILVGDAPVAVLVTMSCLLAPVVCIVFSAVLVAASLIMRHAEALKAESLTAR